MPPSWKPLLALIIYCTRATQGMVLHIPEPHIADQGLARDIDLHLQPSNLDAATTEGRTRRKTVSNGMASGGDLHPITKETLEINGDGPGRKLDAQGEKAINKNKKDKQKNSAVNVDLDLNTPFKMGEDSNNLKFKADVKARDLEQLRKSIENTRKRIDDTFLADIMLYEADSSFLNQNLVQEGANLIEKGEKLFGQGNIKEGNDSIRKGEQYLEEGKRRLERKETLMKEQEKFMKEREKLLQDHGEVTSIFKLIQLGPRMQSSHDKISSEDASNVIKLEPGKDLDKDSSALSPDLDGNLNKFWFRELGIKLKDVLHKIGPSEIIVGDDFDKSFNKRGLLLQRDIFQMVNYMHKYTIMTTKDYQKFFNNPHTLEIATINFFNAPISHDSDWPSYFTSQYVLLNRDGTSSPINYAMRVLDPQARTTLSYLYLKSCFAYFKQLNFGCVKDLGEGNIENQFAEVRDSVFGDEKFINQMIDYQKASLNSKWNKEKFETSEKSQFMKEKIWNILNVFQKVGNQNNLDRREEFQLRYLFIFLNFIEDNLGKELFEAHAHKSSAGALKRYKIMSVRFKFFEEIDQLKLFLQDEFGSVSIPKFVQYPQGHQEDITLSPIEHIAEEYVPKMYSKNHELVSQLSMGEDFHNYLMKEWEKLEADQVNMDLASALKRESEKIQKNN